MIRMDYHIHSSVSPDCREPMEAMCEAALQKGLEEIAFTDHFELYEDPANYPYEKKEYLDDYFTNLERCRALYAGRLVIAGGLEIGQEYIDPEKLQRLLAGREFDFFLGSVHKLRDVDLKVFTFDEALCAQTEAQYYEKILLLARTGTFDCLAHLDLFKRYCRNQGFHENFKKHEETIGQILKSLIEREKGLELNLSGLRQKAQETMPSEQILCMYRELGGELLTVGSDAHRAGDVAADFAYAQELLARLGFRKIFRYRKHVPVEAALFIV